MTGRRFTATKARRSSVPLVVGLYGPSGCGKTWSALALATGMQKVVGGRIALIDTEGGRGLHYADHFDFDHIPMVEPFGSKDYLEAIRFAASRSSVVIVDSMSHEHEGVGGLLYYHEREVTRMAGDDAAKAERVKMLAWQKPKAERRLLLNGMVAIGSQAIIILCFRAKESAKPGKDASGKSVVLQLGFMPIAGDEFVYEATLACFLPPASDGVPNWRPENPGERMMMKLPIQFRELLLDRDAPLDAEVGRALAAWAHGNESGAPSPPRHPDRGQADPTATEGAPHTSRAAEGTDDSAHSRTGPDPSAARDPIHAEAVEAVRDAFRARGISKFSAMVAFAKEAGVSEERMIKCWDAQERSLHLVRLTLDELTMLVDHHERSTQA